jgi:hypothetical protein
MPQLGAPSLLLASTSQHVGAAVAKSTKDTPEFDGRLNGCTLLLGFQFLPHFQ